MKFYQGEIRDLVIAWLALGLAFTLFLNRSVVYSLLAAPSLFTFRTFTGGFALSLLTVGIGFLLHELAHKVVAIRFGQNAMFHADYGMLGLAIASGLAGFLFAAPGAVHHEGRITVRENGIIALAGPVTNLLLVVIFLPFTTITGYIGTVGSLGVTINLLLAAFNMLPFGPLDGKKVVSWSPVIFAIVFVSSIVLTLGRFFL